MEYLEGIPDVLFKYRDYANEYNRRTLTEFEVFLSSTRNFNDPYEGAIPFEYDPSELTPDNIFIKLYLLAKEQNPDWSESKLHEFCFEAQERDFIHDDEHKKKLMKIIRNKSKKNSEFYP